jgi:UDP-N-acetylmuramoyl-L-alanyl-D-glutamate--2,6-diaminopimelate ligase
MKLSELLHHLITYRQVNSGDPDISSLVMDNREVQEGSLFFCIKGLVFNGHEFAEKAVAAGAAAIVAYEQIECSVPVIYVKDTRRALAILSDAYYGHPTRHLHLIGITGTNGKTTTSHIIDTVLRENGKKTGMIGTIDMKINNVSYSVNHTTPEAPFLQKSFRQMKEEQVDAAVMEVSSHALDMGRVRGCDFDIAVFTNLTQDHLDYHENMDEYLRAKGLLFSQLGNTYDRNKPKVAVLNGDDPASAQYERITAAPVITYGIESDSDLKATNIKITGQGTTFTLETTTDQFEIHMKLIGKFSVYNVLAAIAASVASGIAIEKIVETIKTIEGVPGRFEVVDEGQPYTVIVDYSHTPDSLENALSAINEFAEGKVAVVVGCGGNRDKTKRPLMAQIAVKHADRAIFTSDNPRSEDPAGILKDMETGVDEGTYHSIIDRYDAITYAIQNAGDKDIILIAGKGHETYQIVGSAVHDFDDREAARQAIMEARK